MKCCEITPGMMRHRIQLQRAVTTPDGAGGVVTSWETYGSAMAAINPLTGTERLSADRLENPLRKRMMLRYRPGVEERHRVLFDGRAHHIVYVIDIEERRKWLEIGVTQGVAT